MMDMVVTMIMTMNHSTTLGLRRDRFGAIGRRLRIRSRLLGLGR